MVGYYHPTITDDGLGNAIVDRSIVFYSICLQTAVMSWWGNIVGHKRSDSASCSWISWG